MHELVGDITLCILLAWGLGLLAHFTRQPLIVAYLIAGFFIGPFGMGWVKSQESSGNRSASSPSSGSGPRTRWPFRYARQRRSALRIDAGAGPWVRL